MRPAQGGLISLFGSLGKVIPLKRVTVLRIDLKIIADAWGRQPQEIRQVLLVCSLHDGAL